MAEFFTKASLIRTVTVTVIRSIPHKYAGIVGIIFKTDPPKTAKRMKN